MPNNKSGIRKELFLVGGIFAAVFFISISHIAESNGIKVYADEIGYWRNAALLTGRDWSNEASSNVYYGWGYGFLLIPILKFWNEKPEIMMHMAIIMQGLMLSSCIVASWLILRKLRATMSLNTKVVISLFSVLYTANIFMVKFTMSETLLTTCIWWSSYLSLCYVREKKIYQAVGLALISLYMFSVHQRMLTVIIVHILLILVIEVTRQKKNWTDVIARILFYILILVGLLLIYKIYDDYYTSSLHRQAVDAGRGTNRVDTGIMSRISLFVSLKGIIILIKSFCGKFFYSIIATYGFVFCAVTAIVQKAIREYRRKGKIENYIWGIYLLLNFLGALGVSTLAMCAGYETRSDILMYGRYTEFTYGPMLLVGAISLCQSEKDNYRRQLLGILVLLVLCFVCVENTYNTASNSNFWVNCSALSDLVYKVADNELTNKDIILVATMRCVGIMGIFCFSTCFVKRYRTRLVECLLIVIVMMWVYTAEVNWGKNVLPWYGPIRDGMCDIVSEIEQEDTIIVLDARLGGCFQFQLPNAELKICSNMEEMENYEERSYVITDIYSKYAGYIREHYTVDKENSRYMRWVYE